MNSLTVYNSNVSVINTSHSVCNAGDAPGKMAGSIERAPNPDHPLHIIGRNVIMPFFDTVTTTISSLLESWKSGLTFPGASASPIQAIEPPCWWPEGSFAKSCQANWNKVSYSPIDKTCLFTTYCKSSEAGLNFTPRRSVLVKYVDPGLQFEGEKHLIAFEKTDPEFHSFLKAMSAEPHTDELLSKANSYLHKLYKELRVIDKLLQDPTNDATQQELYTGKKTSITLKIEEIFLRLKVGDVFTLDELQRPFSLIFEDLPADANEEVVEEVKSEDVTNSAIMLPDAPQKNEASSTAIALSGPCVVAENKYPADTFQSFRKLATVTGGIMGISKKPDELTPVIGKVLEHIQQNTDVNNKVDIAFVFSTTRSMQSNVENMKTNLSEVLKQREKRANIDCTPLSYAILSYRNMEDEYLHRVDAGFTSDIDKLVESLNKVNTSDAGDEPEAIFDALIAAEERLVWRRDAKRVVILIGNAPPHPKTADDLYDEQTVIDLCTQDEAKRITIYPIIG
ncbi:MAG: VWA domain-containing protein [Verrucomicrobia bacterium]|nr:VWA domain-containing protein [Verrucomicrobiota bacterium]